MDTNQLDIIKKCLQGDRASQKRLYEENKVFLFGICMRYGKSKAEAEDILQEGFYRILKDLKQYSRTSHIKGWMRKVMVNSALMYIRKHHKLKFSALEDKHHNQSDKTDYSLFNSDRAQAIIALIRQLPQPQQTIFNLKAMDGFSFKEISQKLDIKEVTLRSHYHRSRSKLQSLLQQELH